MGPLTRRVFAAVGLFASAACDAPCEFRIVGRLPSTGSVGCCGASVVQEIVIREHRDLAIDIAQVAISNQQGGQDLLLTTPDCERLFDGPYPGPGAGVQPTPRCRVLLGPVQPGRVSPRADVTPGPYRVFVQAYDSNAAANAYHFEVNIWATSCGRTPAGP